MCDILTVYKNINMNSHFIHDGQEENGWISYSKESHLGHNINWFGQNSDFIT